MQSFRTHAKPVVYLILTGFLALTLHVPAAHASLVSTETVIVAQSSALQANDARARLQATLDREDVKQLLAARGVSVDQVQARVAALTDQEAQQLARQIDQLPAGGDPVVTVLALSVFVFLVLLVTDILGFTDIFPFVKKPAR